MLEQYLNKSLDLFTCIYELITPFSCSHPFSNIQDVDIQIKEKMREFDKVREQYIELIDENIEFETKFPRNWSEFVSVKNINEAYVNVNIEFYIDHPKLNMYGIIVNEQEYESHYTFRLRSDEDLVRVINIDNDISISINDGIIDLMRLGEIVKRGKIICDLKEKSILRLPFLYEKKKLCQHDWVINILQSMENEILRISKLTNKQGKMLTHDNSTFLLYN